MTVELVSTAEHTPGGEEFAALYAQAQRFYADQMRILDVHDTARWAGTFTEDALLELPSLPGPLPARAGLARYPRPGAQARRRAGDRLDHWIGVLDVRPQADGTLRTRCSALVYTVPPGAASRSLHVCVMEDVLTRESGEWRIAHRRVTRDDLA
ncbi:nuclear transport factor 2 family protein (plasmid) [Streptomyces sp. cg28]|uniref:nuclear transport factor 2 family protein n=1 Tax=Streptomyces sp. cg28 TaxID=3403457 RepID=UPI003B21787F